CSVRHATAAETERLCGCCAAGFCFLPSSSHSITDSNRADAHYERSPESPPVDFGRHSSSPIEGTPTLSTIIMRDLVSPTNTVENASLRKNATRPVLLRKESYLSATEDTQLSIPVKTSDSKKVNNVAPNNNEATCLHPVFSPSSDTKAVNVKEEVDRETVARASFPHLPTNLLNGTDFEVLKNNLDLGNCLETLFLAKRHGQMSLQQAALGVMSNNYLQVLRDPNLYGRLMAGEREQILKQRMSGRKFVMVADIDPQDWVINTVGETAKTKQGTRSSAVYYYDDYKDSWHRLCMIPLEVVSQACAVCTMDNYLFVAVGCQGTDREMTPSKRVFCYNPLTSIWKEISPMNESRPRCKLAALDGYIYAIGGECLSSVERYDPRLDRWSYVAPLPNDTFAVAHHVTVANGELYVSGGTLRYMLLRYNPLTNTWKSSMLAGGKDRTADMMAVGRFLYRFDVNPMLGVSVYRYHLVARLWYECSCKRLQRCPTFQCVTMNNLIYCVSRQFTISFDADEISPAFTEENLSVLNAAKGILFPFVLSLPDKNLRQTSV
uniref:Kelch domain containing 7A n=1 Tax=Gouania willdenowi TaxID=441366 RepID=A0A8C5D6B0_GOUWI